MFRRPEMTWASDPSGRHKAGDTSGPKRKPRLPGDPGSHHALAKPNSFSDSPEQSERKKRQQNAMFDSTFFR
jgi:hypothetical protein